MKKFDPTEDDPGEWRQEFQSWKQAVAAARRAQTRALLDLHHAESTLARLAAWRDQLANQLTAMTARLPDYAQANALIAELTAEIERQTVDLGERVAARDTASTQLVGGPSITQPVILLPVRLHTAWLADGLAVRFVPSDLSVDRHDPRLTPLEQTLGTAYWVTRGLANTDDQAAQAWRDLTSRLTPMRAAWVVRATAPDAGPPTVRDNELDPAVTVRALPDRFAVVLLKAGEPVDVGSDPAAPVFATWGAAIPRELAVPILPSPGDSQWTTDLAAAVTVGMAVRIRLPASVTGVDEVVAVGVRSESSADGLAALLAAHGFSVGVEVLTPGTPTNNNGTERTTRTAQRSRELGLALTEDSPGTLTAGSAGAALARTLGVPDTALAGVAGTQDPYDDLVSAVAELVALGATGSLRADGDHAGVQTLRPDGPAPALRVGKQPFGVLPAVDLSRYAAGSDPGAAARASVVRATEHRQRVPLDVDPADRDPVPVPARVVNSDDDSARTTLLGESASSVRWTAASTTVDAEGLLGPLDGQGSAQTYLAALAGGSADAATRAAAEESVLGAVAVAAASTADGRAVAARVTAALAVHGRARLADVLAGQLDALSHRPDAWVTATAADRLTTLGPAVLGAFGYVNDVAPRTTPRTFGHIHAPTAGHAATAAVLRSGYLRQRRSAWAQQQAVALAAGDTAAAAAAREGLAALSPLDDATERDLPMAIDLTSARVRRAVGVLDAVRAGQPLAAVLGSQFERALVLAALSDYLGPLRKLTRFTAGTALEALEARRRDAAAAFDTAAGTLDQLRATQASAQTAAAEADAELARAQAAYDALTGIFAPYAVQDAERVQLQSALASVQSQLADLDVHAPTAGEHVHSVQVP